jgi:hypothetical protein
MSLDHLEAGNNDNAQYFCHHWTEKDRSPLMQNDANLVSRPSEPPLNRSETGNHDNAQCFCHHSVMFRHDST